MDEDLNLAKEFFELGVNQFEKNYFSEAEKYFRLSLSYSPNRISILSNLSATLIKLNKYPEAQDIINNILSSVPNNPITHLNQGNLFLKLHNLEDALSEFLIAIKIDPNYPEAYNNYAFILQRLGKYNDALIQYEKAIVLKSDYVEALYNKAQCFVQIKKLDDAFHLIERALKINANYDDLYITYISIRQQICDWVNFDNYLYELLDLINKNINISSLFCLLAIYDNPHLHHIQAKKYTNLEFPFDNILGPIPLIRNVKIKIGYFSADFHNHATAYLIAELFELHDKSIFEIHAFSFGPDNQDHMKNRIKASFYQFHNVCHLSDIQIAQLSRSFNIAIAIDLKGYTFSCRPGIFSKRAAPIQVNYLGYPGTLGAEYIDYIIADHIVIPNNSIQFYTEKIVFLPNSYQVNDSKRIISDTSPNKQDEHLPIDAFVFCCFNNVYKILPDIFIIWMDILKKVDNSVLWLLEDNPTANNNIISYAKLNGVKPNRLIFAKRKKLEDHLARLQLADLFLDTFPYNAHTTSSDALWAGLPVLTCMGNTFASRVTASLLKAIRIPELITSDFSKYKNKALELASNPIMLNSIKERIKHNRMTTPLFNTKQFTSHIEQAYIQMYNIYIDDKPIKNIIIN